VVASLEGMARVRMASCAPTVTGARAAPSGPSSAGMTGTASGDAWMILSYLLDMIEKWIRRTVVREMQKNI
jgi:hypothetical protein